MNTRIEIKIIALYSLFFISALFCLNQFFFPTILDAKNFLNWDAAHYYWIKNYGYKDFRVAFFPMFPMLWTFSGLSVYGIVLFNASLFLVSFYFLLKSLSVSIAEVLLYLSIPSFCFFILPYSESVFFASSTILLLGIKQKKTLLLLSGLLLCTLSRPAFTIFIPALLLAEFVCEDLTNKVWLRILFCICTVLAGVILVGIIQHYYTGIWFNFFKVQQGWGNKLQLPKLPLTSWAGGLIVRLDGTAMLAGTVSGIILLSYIFKAKFIKHITMPKEVVFSLAYLAGITLSVFLFRGGSLFSLNRFVFAVPFIIVAVNFYLKQSISFSTRQTLIAFILLLIFWLAFGSYVHIQALLKYTLLSVYIVLVVLLKSATKTSSKWAMILLIFINIVFQFIFLIRFLSNEWVG
jgi:hypothetical protein